MLADTLVKRWQDLRSWPTEEVAGRADPEAAWAGEAWARARPGPGPCRSRHRWWPFRPDASLFLLAPRVISSAIGGLLVSLIRLTPPLVDPLRPALVRAVHLPSVMPRADVELPAAIPAPNLSNRLNRLRHEAMNWTSAPVCETQVPCFTNLGVTSGATSRYARGSAATDPSLFFPPTIPPSRDQVTFSASRSDPGPGDFGGIGTLGDRWLDSKPDP